MRRQPTNEQLIETVVTLKRTARKEKARIWERVAEHLLRSNRSRAVVNLSRISRHTKSNETAVVPGKVLASGRLAHKVTVAAFSFSAGSMAKIEEAGGKAISLVEAAKKHPKGSKLRLIG